MILLDQNAADGTRPAGLRNGVTALTAMAGGPQAWEFDLGALAAAVAPIGGNDLMYIASPKQAVKIALYRTAEMPFPVASSAGLADTVVMCIALNALVVAGGNDPPKFSVSVAKRWFILSRTPRNRSAQSARRRLSRHRLARSGRATRSPCG